jgi:hypothetical protein
MTFSPGFLLSRAGRLFALIIVSGFFALCRPHRIPGLGLIIRNYE